MKKLFIICLLIQQYVTMEARDYLITSFGVSNDSTVLCTKNIQQTIDQAAQDGGGTVVIPRGVYLTGALFFKPNTALKLMKGAVLKGSDNINDYPLIPSRMEGRKLDYYAALINAYGVDHFSITGPGTINGNGLRFWKAFWTHRDSLEKTHQTTTNLEVHRPRLVFIWNSNHVHLTNVTLCNSGFWTTHLYQCNEVLIEDCVIKAPFAPVPAPSSDGIDIDVCKNVVVRRCDISVNDDAVCIKGGKGPEARKLPENGPVENILIEDCFFGESHGTLTLGSESIFARNIILRNCNVNNNCPVLRIKMRPDTYQTFENIQVSNISGTCGVLIELKPWTQFFDLGESTEKPFGEVRNILFSNIEVKCKNVGIIRGNSTDKISDFLFKDVNVKADHPLLDTDYTGIFTKNVMVNDQHFEITQTPSNISK